MKLTLSLILIPSVAAWVTSRPASVTQQRMRLYEGLEDDNYSFTWQDVYEFDAPLSHCNEQMFVASEWVKSMPCGEKIEVGTGLIFLLYLWCFRSLQLILLKNETSFSLLS